jgi:hypothetical protein
MRRLSRAEVGLLLLQRRRRGNGSRQGLNETGLGCFGLDYDHTRYTNIHEHRRRYTNNAFEGLMGMSWVIWRFIDNAFLFMVLRSHMTTDPAASYLKCAHYTNVLTRTCSSSTQHTGIISWLFHIQ